MRDLRDPEKYGEAIMQMKEMYPNMSAPERADLLDALASQFTPTLITAVSTNGSDHS